MNEIRLPLSERQMGLVAATINGSDPGYHIVQKCLVLTRPWAFPRLLQALARQPDPADNEAARKLLVALRRVREVR